MIKINESSLKMSGDSASGERDRWLDVCRGMAIILVAVGHAIQTHDADFDKVWLFKAIYIFHMPLFFYLCGIVYELKPSSSGVPEFGRSFKRRVSHLLIPFLAWFVFNFFLNSSGKTFVESFQQLCSKSDSGLWFLWILFLCSAIADLSRLIHDQWNCQHWKVCFSLFLLAGIAGLLVKTMGMALLAVHLPFFFLGIFHKELIAKIRWNIVVVFVLSAVAYALLLSVWERNRIAGIVANYMGTLGLPEHPLMPLAFRAAGSLSNMIFPIPGIVIFLIASKLFLKSDLLYCKKLCELFVFIGTRTLGIYAIHFFFIGIPISSSFTLDILFATISSIALSVVIAEYIIKPIKPVSLLLLGR